MDAMVAAIAENGDAAEEPWALPEGWALATLDDLIGSDGLMVDGDWVESKDQNPSGRVRLIQLADIGDGRFLDKSSRFLTEEAAARLRCTFLRRNDILIARMASPLGRACIYPGLSQPAVTVVDVCIWRNNQQLIEPRWLMNAINSLHCRKVILADASGTTRQRVSGGKLKNISLPVPPLPEQRRIVTRVDALFAEIAEGEAALAEARKGLDTFRRALLKSAVTGELTKDWRAANRISETGHYLLARVAKDRAAKGRNRNRTDTPSLDRSALPKLPENWVWASLGELFDVSTGSTPSRSDPKLWDGGVPWVSSGEVAFCRISSTHETISMSGLGNPATRLNPVGTVLLAMIGEGKTRGQCAILDVPAANNQNAAAIRVSATPIPPEFVYHVLEERYFRSRRESQGGNQPALNGGKVAEMAIPLPPLNEIVEILRRISDAYSVAADTLAMLTAEAAGAARLRQSILKVAFEGQLVTQVATDESATELLSRLAAKSPAVRASRGRARKSDV